jgi:single-strand DNA-binding protein
MNFNKVIVLGNLTRDPEVRTLPSGQSVVNFGLATNRFFTDRSGSKQQATEFHNVVAFGKLADICGRYLAKGKLVLVEGRLQTRNWQGQDGVKRYRTEIVMENMQLGPRGTGGSSSAETSAETAAAPAEEIPIIDADEELTANEEKVNVEDIPF